MNVLLNPIKIGFWSSSIQCLCHSTWKEPNLGEIAGTAPKIGPNIKPMKGTNGLAIGSFGSTWFWPVLAKTQTHPMLIHCNVCVFGDTGLKYVVPKLPNDRVSLPCLRRRQCAHIFKADWGIFHHIRDDDKFYLPWFCGDLGYKKVRSEPKNAIWLP